MTPVDLKLIYRDGADGADPTTTSATLRDELNTLVRLAESS